MVELNENQLTRKEIVSLIESKQEQIKVLKSEIIELNRQSCLLSDEEQWFEEKMETFTYRENRKKVTVEKLIGRVHWKEDFKDEGTEEVVTIERSEIVRINGNWNW